MMKEMILFGFLYINRILGFFPITCRVESSRVVKEGRTDSRLLFFKTPPFVFHRGFHGKPPALVSPCFIQLAEAGFVVDLMARDGY